MRRRTRRARPVFRVVVSSIIQLPIAALEGDPRQRGVPQEPRSAALGDVPVRSCGAALPARRAPEENPVEQVFWRLHEAVTRNHWCQSIDELIEAATDWLAVEGGPTTS